MKSLLVLFQQIVALSPEAFLLLHREDAGPPYHLANGITEQADICREVDIGVYDKRVSADAYWLFFYPAPKPPSEAFEAKGPSVSKD